MYLNANSKERVNYKIFNNSKSKEKFHLPLPTNENLSQIKNKLLGMSHNTVRNLTTNTTKQKNIIENDNKILLSEEMNFTNKIKNNQSNKLNSNETISNSKYSVNMKNKNTLLKQKSIDRTSKIKNNYNLTSFISDKSLTHRIDMINKNAQTIQTKQTSVNFSNRNLLKDHNSMNLLETKNLLNNENYNNGFKNRLNNRSKENLKIYSKHQNILIEDRSESKENELSQKIKSISNLNLHTKMFQSNRHMNLGSIYQKNNYATTNTNPNLISNFNSIYKKSSNIHEILLKNFQDNIKNSKGKNLMNKIKNPVSSGLMKKIHGENSKEGYNTLDNLVVDDKPLNNFNSNENLYLKSTSFQEIFNENALNKKSIGNMKKPIGGKGKHDEYKNIQEKANNVKVSLSLNKSQKEKEFDKIFASMDDLEMNYIYTEGAVLPSDNNSTIKLSPEDKTNESGVLTFDEVKDIIVYYHFKDVNINERNIFFKNDVEIFNQENRMKYMNLFFNNQSEVGAVIDNNKSYSTKDSSSNKKNYISLIKSS